MTRKNILERIVSILLAVIIALSLEPFVAGFSYATEMPQESSEEIKEDAESSNESVENYIDDEEAEEGAEQEEPAGTLMAAGEIAANQEIAVMSENTPAPVSPARNTIHTNGRNHRNLGINLKKLLGEKHNGYSVAQGGCTDGTYAYYLMVSSYNQKGKILKTRIRDNAVVAKSGVIDICHGNGMALDTKRNRLVVVGREGRRNQLTIINVGEEEYSIPTFGGYAYVDYTYSANWTSKKSTFDGYGISAIAYVAKYDCFVAVQRSTHELLILNPDFRVIGVVGTTITKKYPGTYQAIDADERYVYMLLSYYNSAQPHNIILVMEWHGEKLQEYAEGNKAFFEKSWKCGKDGTPSAVVYTNTPYEAENIYHVDQGDGTARFYLTEYNSNPQYKWTTKKKSYKVKWKKVKKKVKWKKVKKKGKWKWKYKTKKVWKYKKKYKKVKVKVLDYYNRDNYVYDLGIM